VLAHDPRERFRQGARATFRGRPAERLPPRGDRERQQPGAGLVHVRHGHERKPEEEGPHVLVRESLAHGIERARVAPADRFRALGRRLERGDRGARGGRRRVPRPVLRVLDRVPVREQLLVRARVVPREARELAHGRRPVAEHRDASAVGERHHDARVGKEVAQPVRAEAQLVVPDDRTRLEDRVRARAEVVPEAGQRDLFGRRVATDRGRPLEDEHAQARAGEIRRAEERVVPGAGDDDVVLAHSRSGPPRARRSWVSCSARCSTRNRSTSSATVILPRRWTPARRQRSSGMPRSVATH